jgi:hypothetical protein
MLWSVCFRRNFNILPSLEVNFDSFEIGKFSIEKIIKSCLLWGANVDFLTYRLIFSCIFSFRLITLNDLLISKETIFRHFRFILFKIIKEYIIFHLNHLRNIFLLLFFFKFEKINFRNILIYFLTLNIFEKVFVFIDLLLKSLMS